MLGFWGFFFHRISVLVNTLCTETWVFPPIPPPPLAPNAKGQIQQCILHIEYQVMTQLTMVCGRTVKGFWIMGPTQVIGGVTSISPNWGGGCYRLVHVLVTVRLKYNVPYATFKPASTAGNRIRRACLITRFIPVVVCCLLKSQYVPYVCS